MSTKLPWPRPFITLSLILTGLLIGPTVNADPHRVHFESTVTETVMPDTFVVTLRAYEEGPDATQVSRAINRRMQQALNRAKRFADITMQTEGYRVSPVYDRQHQLTHWRGQQRLRLTTQAPSQLSQLLQQLESSLQYQHQSYRLSDARLETMRAQLLTQATKHYRDKAQSLARLLGHDRFKLAETRIDPIQGLNAPPRPILARSLSETSRNAEPAIEADAVTLTQTIRGVMVLPDS
ncbi:SIMPL domain-containing protein [Thiomicrospira sp. WB1]|uniref:SIMPL domain-containing protein n=1 Tax=Thiomicrospira sp. WB1 TaxID=1685380 RepID=UPI0007481E1A|nr:SIMPL domain-containing protein [Thiomicrospira sp. WB1]KUJ71104.1 hypothetical protein AVO41_09545 [Thiomicrospira sp. WB1]